MRGIRFHRGRLAENPVGEYVTFMIGDRTYNVEVVSVWYDPMHSMHMLSTKHFNGEEGPHIAAGLVRIIEDKDR